MTEKRYSLDDRLVLQNVVFDGVIALSDYEVVNRLNEQHEENIKLNNTVELLEEENKNLNEFFLHNCKSTEYIEWLRSKEE